MDTKDQRIAELETRVAELEAALKDVFDSHDASLGHGHNEANMPWIAGAGLTRARAVYNRRPAPTPLVLR